MTRYIAPLLFGLVGTAILVSLGLWQLQRLEWKEAILAEIDARMAADPIALPAEPNEAEHRFTPVQIEGTVQGDPVFVFTTIPDQGVRFRVIYPMTLADQRSILVELGTVDPDVFDQVEIAGAFAITGMMHWPQETDAFTPPPDPDLGYFYARDVDALATLLQTEPVFVVAETVDPVAPLLVPGLIDTSAIPNNHLEYVLTWFGFAIVWVGMTLLWLRRTAQRHY